MLRGSRTIMICEVETLKISRGPCTIMCRRTPCECWNEFWITLFYVLNFVETLAMLRGTLIFMFERSRSYNIERITYHYVCINYVCVRVSIFVSICMKCNSFLSAWTNALRFILLFMLRMHVTLFGNAWMNA